MPEDLQLDEPVLPVPEADEEEVVNGPCPVVGIGASAGGLEAISIFLAALPPTTGLAYVIVQHLDPKHESILAEILSRQTSMPVVQAEQSTPVAADHVYVIPPNTRMTIQKGILQLTPRETDRSRHLPIDYFLCSLAADQKSRAFGIILSGTASDGTIGIKAIKSEGGITFAQDDTAKYDSMPRSAIAASVIDFILPPERMARELARIAHHSYLGSPPNGVPVEEGPVLQRVFSLLKMKTGVDFSHYKRPTIQRRLSRRMALLQKTSSEAYLSQLEQNPQELAALYDDLLINVTEFFRDPATFDLLNSKVFPLILQDRKSDETIRIWVPACSSGEEVYSIAICLAEYLENTQQVFPVQIFGTDISERAIESARGAKFTGAIAAVVSPQRLKRYFIPLEGGGFQITRSIRQQCIFSRQDLTKDSPLSKMDLISCRNLLIYLSQILQRRVLSFFAYALQPRGVLLLGNSESVGSLPEHFLALDRESKLYTRNLHVDAPGMEVFSTRALTDSSSVAGPARARTEDVVTILDREADRLVLDQYAPSGLLINSENQVLKFRGDMARYVAPPLGTASLDIYKVVREDLVPALRSAILEATAKDTLARREHIQVSRDDRFTEISITVRPMSRWESDRHYLILFVELPHQERQPDLKNAQTGEGQSKKDLADELASTRTYLQSLIEELRTANEETQSANEELQSTNEELQTAKEELQSSNEELTTTNDEMQSRNVELSELNNDLINLLSSMRVPIVMLNKDLRIRRFTPMSEKALNLIPTDVGRPISDLKPRINEPDLEFLLLRVIHSAEAIEKEVQDQEGHWYSMRINPYRTGENRVEGAVLQLLDIDQLKRTLETSEDARRYTDAILATVREPLVVLDDKLCIHTANRSFSDAFGIPENALVQQSILEVGNGLWDIPRLRQMLGGFISGAETGLQDIEIEQNFPKVGWRTFQFNARALQRDGGRLILLAMEDITHRKTAAEAKYRRLFEAAKDGIVIVDAETGEVTDVNQFVIDLLGFARDEYMGKRFWETGPLSETENADKALPRLRKEEVVRFADLPLRTKDNRTVDVEVVGNIYMEGDKRVVQFNIRDITERKQFAAQLQQSAKLESLGLLAGGVAHDFNNLLTGIMGNASLVLDNTNALSEDRDALREIVKASQRAADLTRQMLAYSGRGRFVVRMTDFSELAREISSLVRSSIPKSVDLQLRLADKLPAVAADAAQIHQLVMNLVINAAEAIGEYNRGVVRVTTSFENLDAESIRSGFGLDEIGPGVYVTLEVMDSGSGMDEATRAKIFDPFFTTKFTGRGLGLAAALGIVKGHRGAIQVDSQPGKGTTFKVYFPAVPAAEIPVPAPLPFRDLRGSGLILVVDDEEMVLNLAVPALRRYGYQVLTAPHGEVAVEIVRARGSELSAVILDMTMPVMGGEETAIRIKEICPNLPVILSSGYDEAQVIKRLGENVLAGFIQKPYTIQWVLEALKAALNE